MPVVWECCLGPETIPDRVILEDLLPKEGERTWVVNSFQITERSSTPGMTQFLARLTIQGCETMNYKEVLNEFYESSDSEFNKDQSDKAGTGTRKAWYGRRKCIRSPRDQKEKLSLKEQKKVKEKTCCRSGPNGQKGMERRPGLDTRCAANLGFTVSRCKPAADHSNCQCFNLEINWLHNHRTKECLDAGNFKTVKPNVETDFMKIFNENKTPTQALIEYENKLKEVYGEDKFIVVSSDRSIFPDKKWVRNIYEKHINALFGTPNG